MLNNLTPVFALVGMVTTLTMIIAFFVVVVGTVKDLIEHLIRLYKIKHRFDKPPVAKCYCKDCVKHCDNGKCMKFEKYYTGDGWFCWDAEPRH